MKNIVSLLTILLAGILLVLTGCMGTSSQNNSVPPRDQSQDELIVGITANAKPLIYKQGGKILGLEADLAREFATYLNMKLRFVELPWDEQIPSLLNGKIDIIMSGLSVTKLRSYRINFSDPYFRTGQMLLVRLEDADSYPRGYYDLKWKKDITIGTVKRTTGSEFITRNIKRATQRNFANSKNGVNALLTGTIDAFVYDAPMVMAYAAGHEGTLAPIYNLLTEEYLAWGISKENISLQKYANSFLTERRENGSLESIFEKWLPMFAARNK